jgi:hypothetical protein
MEDWIILFYGHHGLLFGSRILGIYWSIVIYVVESLELRICLRLLRLLDYLDFIECRAFN